MSTPATPVPFHLRYSLTRAQRLIPHLRIWGLPAAIFVVICFGFFTVSVGTSAAARRLDGVLLFVFLALAVWWAFRGLLRGLLDVLFVPVRQMDLVVEENAVGLMWDGQRWYLWLDGITRISRLHPDVWTLQHHNGSVLHIPVTVITPEQLQHFQKAMEYGRTPEGIQAVIKRGKRLAGLEARDRRAG
jgi:hypothetical protein